MLPKICFSWPSREIATNYRRHRGCSRQGGVACQRPERTSAERIALGQGILFITTEHFRCRIRELVFEPAAAIERHPVPVVPGGRLECCETHMLAAHRAQHDRNIGTEFAR